MHWPTPLVRAQFIRRVNRFRAEVMVAGTPVAAHVPNSGRLHDLFHPQAPVWLAPHNAPGRKTAYDLLLVEQEGVLVSIDARLPPRLLAEAIARGLCDDWLGAPGDAWQIQHEPRHGTGRFDLYLSGPAPPWWIETKSVTLVERRVAYFPDAPTARGRRHLAELAQMARDGVRSAVIFVVQRPDAQVFAPHPHADPAFPTVLRQAAAAGVLVRAYACTVTLDAVYIVRPLPVQLDPLSEHRMLEG